MKVETTYTKDLVRITVWFGLRSATRTFDRKHQNNPRFFMLVLRACAADLMK